MNRETLDAKNAIKCPAENSSDNEHNNNSEVVQQIAEKERSRSRIHK